MSDSQSICSQGLGKLMCARIKGEREGIDTHRWITHRCLVVVLRYCFSCGAGEYICLSENRLLVGF